MSKLSDETIQQLKAKHGEGNVYSTTFEHAGQIAFRRPTQFEFDRFIARVDDERAAAVRDLVDACVLFPTGKEFSELSAQFPGLAFELGRRIREAASGGKGGPSAPL